MRTNLVGPVACLLALTSCMGEIGSTPADQTGSTRCSGKPVDPGPLLLRRLTNAEYLASVNTLLGVDAAAEVALFPADLRRTGFDNGYDLQTVSITHADRYHSAAKNLTTAVFAQPARRDAVLGCDVVSGGDACLRTFIGSFGRRAFRRTLTSSEVDDYLAVAKSEPQPHEGAALVVRAMLESPLFLWRVEVGEAVDGDETRRKLTGLELATRLAFFLWSAPPDEALLTAAEGGALDTVEGVEAQARAMLMDPRARASFERFTDQWFRVDSLEGLTRTASLFPGYDAALRTSMRRELHSLFSTSLWTPRQRMLGVYSTRSGFLDDKLATLYGVTNPQPGQVSEHDWGDDPERGGLFTTAGLLTITTRNDFTSPIQRGLFVREAALCDHFSPPPGGVPPISLMPGETPEQAESRHTSDPNCTGCHLLIDPVGAGLERYDALGQLRTAYPNGKPVLREGKIVGLPVEEYQGGVELGERLASSKKAEQCAVRHTFRWALARNEELGGLDACTLEQLTTRFATNDQSFTELVIGIVTHDTFRFRRSE